MSHEFMGMEEEKVKMDTPSLEEMIAAVKAVYPDVYRYGDKPENVLWESQRHFDDWVQGPISRANKHKAKGYLGKDWPEAYSRLPEASKGAAMRDVIVVQYLSTVLAVVLGLVSVHMVEGGHIVAAVLSSWITLTLAAFALLLGSGRRYVARKECLKNAVPAPTVKEGKQ